MPPLGFLHRLAKALLQHWRAAGASPWGPEVAGQVCQLIWNDWQQSGDETRWRHDLEAVAEMTPQGLRDHVAKVAGEVAAGLDAGVRASLADCLADVADRLRQTFLDAGESSAAIPVSNAAELATLLTAAHKPPVPRVTLIQTDGPLKGRQFVFEGASSTVLGREPGCHPPFPKDKEHKTISRHHCLLDINPPDISVRDLGSMGGTYVNGQLIGKRSAEAASGDAAKDPLAECFLKNGDELRLCLKGTAVFQVKVTVPSVCVSCGILLSDSGEAPPEEPSSSSQCAGCRSNAVLVAQAASRPCVQCGRDVAGEAGARRQGEYICSACRQKLTAAGPEPEAPTIRGYTVRKFLGHGGMGAVWLARQDLTHDLIAMKVMLPSVAADQRAVKRFLQEINITRNLRHPNLVRLLDAGYQRGTFFLALDYCDAGTVTDLMKQRGGVLPIDEAVGITLQVLEGLHYAHNFFRAGKGLVHRDLKPDNLFLIGSGAARLAKIGDYGLAKAFDDTGLAGLTRTGETAGTPRFMPRAQIHHFKNPTPDFDVWAVAATLYNMLTRRYPRAFTKSMDPWRCVLETDPVPIRRRLPDLPAKLADVIDHALVEKPEIGFKTAAAFKKALEEAS